MGWAYARFEEGPYSAANSREEAIAELGGHGGWIGQDRPPTQPEAFWRANDWLDHVSCQDDYSLECAEGWDCSTKEQRRELEEQVRSVMAAWLDRHGLRPRFFLVESAEPVDDLTNNTKPD